MKEYKFVKIELKYWSREPKEDYKEIIREHAREGWRLVQIFAPAIYGYGYAKDFQLIFEKDV